MLNGELRTALDREVPMLVAAYGLIGKDAICDCAIGTIKSGQIRARYRSCPSHERRFARSSEARRIAAGTEGRLPPPPKAEKTSRRDRHSPERQDRKSSARAGIASAPSKQRASARLGSVTISSRQPEGFSFSGLVASPKAFLAPSIAPSAAAPAVA